MEVNFSNTFFDSFKKMISHERWYFKLWFFFKRGLPGFFRNIWIFRKALWNHRWWDWRYTMEIMQTSLKEMERGMQNGLEIRESRNKKIYKMRKAIYLMDRFMEDDFVQLAEKELGPLPDHPLEFVECEDNPDRFEMKDNDTEEEKIHRRKVYDRAREIEEQMWNELWETFKGQDYSKFDDKKEWNDQFDGSGMRGWWD
jgi:hypothetical protein